MNMHGRLRTYGVGIVAQKQNLETSWFNAPALKISVEHESYSTNLLDVSRFYGLTGLRWVSFFLSL